MNPITPITKQDIPMLAAAKLAGKHGLHMINRGTEIRLSGIVPPGWKRMGAVQKPATSRSQSCAA